MIRFDGVTKTYRGTSRPALNGVTLEVLKGEFVFLVGASGSGKSSFLRLILKEDVPTTGTIHVLGQDVGALPSRKVPYFRRSLGVVFQDFRLLPNKTVFDNVAFTLQVIGKSAGFIQEAVPDVLKLVGLGGKQNRYPHELSGGEQQRVAIARAVVNKPAILLADEPTGNLDPATSAGIMALLATINANGTTVVMATHDAGIVDSMKRRVIELTGGQIIRDERQGGYTTTVPVQKPGSRRGPDAEFDDEALAPAAAPAPLTVPIGVGDPLADLLRPEAPRVDLVAEESTGDDVLEPPAEETAELSDPEPAAPVAAPEEPDAVVPPAPAAPPVATPERASGPVIPEPGSGPPPGFEWPTAPARLRGGS